MRKLNPLRCRHHFPKPVLVLATFAFLVSTISLCNFHSVRSLLPANSLCSHVALQKSSEIPDSARSTIDSVVKKIVDEMKELSELSTEPEPSTLIRQTSFLADVLKLLESVKNDTREIQHPLVKKKKKETKQEDEDEAANFFLTEEIRKYVKAKPNRLRKQSFMGSNATYTSIGHACFAMKEELEEYMDYDVGEMCNDDWKLGQRLMVHGCDPLPRRRCFARAPKLYMEPFPINESMWKLPDDRNVRWSGYKCKNFTCLASNRGNKGFFKCADCFNLSHHESPRWIEKAGSVNLTADFLIQEVLGIKPGLIRIGLDFSVGTGTFAARMRDHNVTIISATINFGAPFNEIIALRGLIPLYLTINQRLPFLDNTLDLIHSSRFLDGWIDFVLLDFVLFDWDRVLRPGGLLWIDSFFCSKEDLDDYLEAFKALRYRKKKWVVVPKRDKDHREVFFSAVLEKPPRPFR